MILSVASRMHCFVEVAFFVFSGTALASNET
jgi:hypothetical protein